jgi:hypothetical protein
MINDSIENSAAAQPEPAKSKGKPGAIAAATYVRRLGCPRRGSSNAHVLKHHGFGQKE